MLMALRKPKKARDIKDVWLEYKRTGTDGDRNVLIEHYLPLVRYGAERIHVKLPREVELDDLMSAGIFGLVQSINAFDLERGVKFETYCAPRIRGAILDELRNMDWVPRLVRSRAQKIEGATRSLENELGRLPTNEEVRRRLKVKKAEFEKMMKDAVVTSIVSLSRKWFETDSNKDVREIDVLQDRRCPNPTTTPVQDDTFQKILKGLTRAEKLVILLYYRESMTMKEVGATLDLSESRVSQMHSNILARLRAQLQQWYKENYPETERRRFKKSRVVAVLR